MIKSINLFKQISLSLIFLFFAFLLLRITLAYFPIRTDVAFLKIKQQYLPITHWKIAFFIHVFSSMFVLLSGFFQFWTFLLKRYPRFHRTMGYIYVLAILFITGPASFIMALYANGGLISRFAFGILAILWIYFTTRAWICATKKRFVEHKAFMIRSFALTLSAVTLRAWKYVIVYFFHPAPMDVYRIVAWLGWTLNLAVAEYIIYKYQPKLSLKFI